MLETDGDIDYTDIDNIIALRYHAILESALYVTVGKLA